MFLVCTVCVSMLYRYLVLGVAIWAQPSGPTRFARQKGWAGLEFSAHNPFGSAPFRPAQERIKTSRPGLGGPARFVSLSLSLTCQLSASLVSLGFLSYSFESFPSSLPFRTPHNNTLGPSPAPRRHCQQPSTVTPRS